MEGTTTATRPEIEWTLDRWPPAPGEGGFGYVDLTLDGEHVGSVAVSREPGSRRWEAYCHDALPALGLEEGALLDVAPASRPETVARRIAALAETLRQPTPPDPKRRTAAGAYAAILAGVSAETRQPTTRANHADQAREA